MYTIEYYKTKRDKSKRKATGHWSEESKDTCWDIKSLTIDKEDIKHILYDDRLIDNFNQLVSSALRWRTREWYKDLDRLQILNNNMRNERIIYEIINCEWMINRDEINELDTLKVVRNLCKYFQRYDRTNDPDRKERAKILLNYYMNTIMNIDKPKQKSNGKVLKLGTRHVWDPTL
ncbi:MAG: hypothetical protein IJI58_06005 [Bacilli bacterium]|nr:hypothetical protein [Bacilli bacterium]